MTFSKYQSAFDIFHNTTAEIVTLGDYDDYENTYSGVEVVGETDGDLQPYSGGLAAVLAAQQLYSTSEDKKAYAVGLLDECGLSVDEAVISSAIEAALKAAKIGAGRLDGVNKGQSGLVTSCPFLRVSDYFLGSQKPIFTVLYRIVKTLKNRINT